MQVSAAHYRMASHSSAPMREQEPHATETTQTTHNTQAAKTELKRATGETQASQPSEPTYTFRRTRTATIINTLKQRALSVLYDTSLDAQSRAVIRYALETNDPWLAELVRRAEKGEAIAESIEQLARDPA